MLTVINICSGRTKLGLCGWIHLSGLIANVFKRLSKAAFVTCYCVILWSTVFLHIMRFSTVLATRYCTFFQNANLRCIGAGGEQATYTCNTLFNTQLCIEVIYVIWGLYHSVYSCDPDMFHEIHSVLHTLSSTFRLDLLWPSAMWGKVLVLVIICW